jgi:hypothetical protein
MAVVAVEADRVNVWRCGIGSTPAQPTAEFVFTDDDTADTRHQLTRSQLGRRDQPSPSDQRRTDLYTGA